MVPDPVVGSNEVVVPTMVPVDTPAGNFVPETGALVTVGTPQEFPPESRDSCSIRAKLNGTRFGAEAQSCRAVNPVLKHSVRDPLPLAANLPARLASVTPPWSSWAWLTPIGPPIIVAIRINNPSPVARPSFISFIARTPSLPSFIEFSPLLLWNG